MNYGYRIFEMNRISLDFFIQRGQNKFAMSVYLGNVQTERDIVHYSGSKSGASFVYPYKHKYYKY